MPRRPISFDWALKRLLRSKAHFGILEGFLSELLQGDIQILEILDSESGRDTPLEKLNRVDLRARNQRGEIILIEVQYERHGSKDRHRGESALAARAGVSVSGGQRVSAIASSTPATPVS